MFLLRRTAFRALSTPSTSLLSKPRSIVTAARAPLITRQQWAVPKLQRRFASDEATAETTEEVAEESPAQTISEELVVEPASAAEAETVTEEAATDGAEPTEQVESVKANAFGTTSSEPASASTPIQDTLSSIGAAAGSAASAVSSAVSSAVRSTNATSSSTPSANISPSTTIYVGNLFFEVTEEALQRQFAHYGPIKKTRLVYDHRGLSKGFGYIEFEKVDDAAAAITALNQEVFQGRRMAVQFHRRREPINLSKPRTPNEPSKTLFIGNMSFEMSDKDLNDLFREVRNVIDVRVAIDRRTGQPRGFAHADFIDVDSAMRARDFLKEKEIYGRKLRVDYSMSSSNSRQV